MKKGKRVMVEKTRMRREVRTTTKMCGKTTMSEQIPEEDVKVDPDGYSSTHHH